MSNFQTKASNLLTHLLKENQQRQISKSLVEAGNTCKVSQQQKLIDTKLENCSYCSKVFSDSRCLIKHLLRRHADDLLHLHNEFIKKSQKKTPYKDNFVTKLMSSNLEKEMAELKKLLKDFKIEVIQQLQSISLNDYSGDNSNNRQLKTNQECLQKSSEHEVQSEIFQKFHLEFQELKLQCQHFETLIQSLEKKYNSSVENVRCEIVRNEDNRQQSDNEIRRMVRNISRLQKKEVNAVKEELEQQLTALRQTIFFEMQKQYSGLDNKLINFESKHLSDVQMLHSFCQQNCIKLDHMQNDFNTGELLEKHLKSYLKKMPQKSNKKCNRSKKLLNNFVTPDSKHTSNLQSCDILETFSESYLAPVSFVFHTSPSMLSQRESSQPLSIMQEKQIPVKKSLNDQNKSHKPLFITKRVNIALKNNPNVLLDVFKEISEELENKLQGYGFLRGQRKLSISEFEIKRKLISDEFHQTCNIHDFVELKNKIDDLVTKKVKLYISQNRYEKGTFVGSKFVNPSCNVKNIATPLLYNGECSGDVGNDNFSKTQLTKSIPQIFSRQGDVCNETFIKSFDESSKNCNNERPPTKSPKSLSKNSGLQPILVKPLTLQENQTSNVETKCKEDTDNQPIFTKRELNFNDITDDLLPGQNYCSTPISEAHSLNLISNKKDSGSSLESISNWDSDEVTDFPI